MPFLTAVCHPDPVADPGLHDRDGLLLWRQTETRKRFSFASVKANGAKFDVWRPLNIRTPFSVPSHDSMRFTLLKSSAFFSRLARLCCDVLASFIAA
jgi:hypothetical protein